MEAAPEEAMLDLSAVTLLAPIPVPPQIRDFLVFERHLEEAFAMAERVEDVRLRLGTRLPLPAVRISSQGDRILNRGHPVHVQDGTSGPETASSMCRTGRSNFREHRPGDLARSG